MPATCPTETPPSPVLASRRVHEFGRVLTGLPDSGGGAWPIERLLIPAFTGRLRITVGATVSNLLRSVIPFASQLASEPVLGTVLPLANYAVHTRPTYASQCVNWRQDAEIKNLNPTHVHSTANRTAQLLGSGTCVPWTSSSAANSREPCA